jgi:FHA domain
MATCPSGHESADDDFCDVCGFAIGPPTATTSTPAAVTGSTLVATTAACPQCGVPRAGQFCESCGYDFSLGDGGGPQPTRIEPARPVQTPQNFASAAQAAAAPSSGAPASAAPAPPTRPPTSAPPPPPPPPASASAPSPAPAPAAPPRPPATPAAPAGATWTAIVTADRAYYDSVQAAGAPGAEGISFPVYCPQRRFPLVGTEVRVGRRSAHTGIDPEIDLTGPPSDPGVSRLHAVLLKAADGSWSVIDPGSANGTLVNGSEIARDEPVPLRDGDRIHLGAWTELTIRSDDHRRSDEQQRQAEYR